MQTISNTVTFGATGTEQTASIFENGIITHYSLVVANLTNSVTATLSILDDDDITIYTGDAKAENATSVVSGLSIPCGMGYTAKVTLSGVAGGTGGDVVIKLYIENR